jgi:hypothetical protein
VKSTDGYWSEMRNTVQGKIGCNQEYQEENKKEKE